MADTLADAAAAMADNTADPEPQIACATPELLWEVLTAERWALLKAIAGAGPVSIDQAAERSGRDFELVRADADAMAQAGILDRRRTIGSSFPTTPCGWRCCCGRPEPARCDFDSAETRSSNAPRSAPIDAAPMADADDEDRTCWS